MKAIRRRDPAKTTTERGYGWAWQQLRLRVLASEPLCRFCKDRGIITVAEEVDHIDGNSHNNDFDNLRPLCRPCHLARTAQDQAFGTHQWRPEWLKPSIVPLTIVCGPPAGGKSTWVRSRAGVDDLLIDLDLIASRLSGQPPTHAWDREKWLTPAIRARNDMLGDIARHANWPAAWLIISEAKPDNRQWWADKVQPKSIVVIETKPAECIARARLDPDRSPEKTIEAIGHWWSEYERRDGDTIVRAAQPTGGPSKRLERPAS